MSDKKEIEDKLSLDYHSEGRPGKIEITPTKPCITSRDLSLAYTPGVAAPCLEIDKDPENAYKYTSKGNLVGVISNGSAVLGLGNIGPYASKPVMEGKAILFKRFADIDVFDIEIDETDPQKIIQIIKALGPTFGGINIEDIKAPECFEIERQLIKEMDIPVFHDDQHGTAIICCAGFLNALELQDKKIDEVKIVFSGAGAAAMACAHLMFKLGLKRENLLMCDSKGVIYKGRKEGMNKYKEEFAVKTDTRNLADAMKGADAFMGVSRAGVVSKEMVKSMNDKPIIFAMANPVPEIYPNEIEEVRKDAIVATGRSDFPNQVNNVLGFPFIFRGALDVRAKTINLEMKLAAVYALANLAKEDITSEVKMAYENKEFKFGPKYIIPKPFDKRVLTSVAPAVAKAAMDSGVARQKIANIEDYARSLHNKLGSTSATFMKSLRDRLASTIKKRGKKVKVAFSAGSNSRILKALNYLVTEDIIDPILLGNKKRVDYKIKKYHLDNLKDIPVIDPMHGAKYSKYHQEFYKMRERKGANLSISKERLKQEIYYGAMMLKDGDIDSLVSGPRLTFPELFTPIMNVIGTDKGHKAAGVFILCFKNKILFLADTTTQIEPSEEDLENIAIETAKLYRKLVGKEPNIAFLSFSNFGSTNHKLSNKVRNAVERTRKNHPDLNIEGEVQADVAVNKELMDNLFPFNRLNDAADILIFPDLNSANISYKLLSQLGEAEPIGPIMIPMNKSVNILQRTADLYGILNMIYLTALLSVE
ncbi:MAG: NADP-dependent malic enzyme [Epsilonproteobacteria bacterium]|nr:MAG: NADP-dependent malic enzyme [Campylobacterota bacterium]